MRNALLLLLLPICVACAAGAAAPPGDANPPAAPTGDASVPNTIEGYYRVAGAGGQDVDLPWGVTLVIEAGLITLESSCIRPVWSYSYSDGALETSRVPTAMCRRAIMPAEQAAINAIEAAEFVIRTPENALVLQGDGGTLTLFSQ